MLLIALRQHFKIFHFETGGQNSKYFSKSHFSSSISKTGRNDFNNNNNNNNNKNNNNKTWLPGGVASFPYTPISPRINLVQIVPDQYFWLIGRTSAKQSGTCGQSRAITWEGLERSGAIPSVLRESGTEKVIGYCF